MNPIDWPRQTPERIVRTSLHDPDSMRELLSSAIPKLARNLGSAKTEFEKGLKASKNGEAPAGESKETPPPSSPTDTDTPS